MNLQPGQSLVVTYAHTFRKHDAATQDEEWLEVELPLTVTGDELTVSFYHGRRDPDQDMDDWGEDVAEFKETQGVEITEKGVRLISYNLTFEWYEDMLKVGDYYCGDFSVTGVTPD